MMEGLVLVLMTVSLVAGKHDNFCRPLEDYGPRYDKMEQREVCGTTFQKACEVIRASDCMNVTELACEVELFTTCSMNWTMKDSVESVMKVQSVDLKNCTKEMVIEYHNKTVYECRNVTKKHCTTLWTMNSITGEKIWTGNEDDCRDVTWEECSPLVKTVPMSVAQMSCESVPVSFFDYENTTSPRMADILDCLVDKKVVCSPVTSTKCADVTYTKCEEVPVTNCSTIDIPVPSQDKLHKQWCLFDQTENIDFNAEVRKIKADTEPDVYETELEEEAARDLEILDDLDLAGSESRNIGFSVTPVFDDLRSLQHEYGKKKRNVGQKYKQNKQKKNQSQSKRITRVAKNVTLRKH